MNYLNKSEIEIIKNKMLPDTQPKTTSPATFTKQCLLNECVYDKLSLDH